jgi:hypothetical protein
MATEIKPRTIPEALGLTDRKCVAIAGTIKETLNERSTIDALIVMRTSVYSLSMRTQ